MSASLWTTALFGLALIAVLALGTWLASLVQRDVSLVDRMWPVLIAGAAAAYFLLLPQATVRGGWLLALVLAWGVRLCVYITARNWGHGEDRRYQQIRARNQPGFAFKSLYLNRSSERGGRDRNFFFRINGAALAFEFWMWFYMDDDN